jgi:hypothetical protein
MSHAKLSPSASKRWLTCTASPGFVEELMSTGVISRDTDSKYSIEGTEAHDHASNALRGMDMNLIPPAFRGPVGEYVDACRELQTDGHVTLIEQKIPLFYSPTENGTVDFAVLLPDRLHIRDLKYGAGVPVSPFQNTQLAIYAHSLIVHLGDVLDFPEELPVSIGIHQPRYTGEDSLKIWETTVGDLKEMCEDITVVAKRIAASSHWSELEFAPSDDACKFCPAGKAQKCDARLRETFDSFPVVIDAVDAFTPLDLPKPKEIRDKTLVALLRHKKEITKFYSDVEDYLMQKMASGTKVKGIKMVLGREGNREWANEGEAEKFLLSVLKPSEAKKTALVSVATAEKLLKTHFTAEVVTRHLSGMVTRSEGKPTLAMEDDKRPALEGITDIFSIVENPED